MDPLTRPRESCGDGVAGLPAAPGAGQRYFATLLFADLTGSTHLSSKLEAEHVDTLLMRLSEIYGTVVARHGGLVVRIHGDGLLAIFGYPDPLDDEGRRAVEAALELHERVRTTLRLEVPVQGIDRLTLHSGIHAGLTLIREGGLITGRLEVTGVAPAIAKHLSDEAQPDEILVSVGTLGPDSGLYVIQERRTLLLHGLSAPVEAYSIVGRAVENTRYEARVKRGLSPFVGRGALTGELAAALEAAAMGPAQAVALVGAPGMGKTRLAHHFLDRCEASGNLVLRAYCESYLGAEPLQPFQQMLRALLPPRDPLAREDALEQASRHIMQRAPGWSPPAAFLPLALSLNTGSGTPMEALPPQAVHGCYVSLFLALAHERPLVLFMDDWQWADDASHRVLAALTEARVPMLLLLTVRAGAGVGLALPQSVRAIELPPLDGSESERTVKRWLPEAHPFLVREICDYAGGNPLFIEELCHRAASDAKVHLEVHMRGGEAWLAGLIAARVGRLPRDLFEVVQRAAIIGDTMPVWLFERITGCSAQDPRVQALADDDLIFPGEQPETLRFKHAITRDVVYDGVGLQDRKRLHRATAEALAGRSADLATTGAEACEALAYHFNAAEDYRQAAAYAEAAGDRAVFASALDRAKSLYRTALSALELQGPTPGNAKRWGGIAQRLGLVSVFDPTRDELALFRRAIELAQATGDVGAIARARYWLGYMHYALGDAPAALSQLAAARDAAGQADDTRLAVQIDATLGQALASAGRYGQALELLDTAIAIKRQHRTGAGNAIGLTYSLTCRGYALGDQGAFSQAHECFDEALNDTGCDQPEVIGSVRGWYAAVLIWQGRYEEAAAHAREAWREGERVRSLHLMSMGRAVASFAHWRRTGEPAAIDDLDAAVGWLSHRGNSLFSSLNHGWLAQALAERGDVAGARRHVAQALLRARRSDMLGSGTACRAMCLLSLREGDPARAERWLARARHWAEVRGSRREQAENDACASELALACGHAGDADRLMGMAACAFDEMGMHAQLVRLRGLGSAAGA